MRWMVQGIGLAVLALVAFGVSGWFFLYEQALHGQGVVVEARIEGIDPIRRPRGLFRRSSVNALFDTVRFSYTMPDGRSYVVAQTVMVDYSMAHRRGDVVALRVDPFQPRKFEVKSDDYARKGLMIGSAGMLLALGAALSFWLAYEALLEKAQAAQVMPRPKARLRRIYMRRP